MKRAIFLILAMAVAVGVRAQDYCTEGAVNLVAHNYLDPAPTKAACALVLNWESPTTFGPSGWEAVGELADVGSLTRAYRLMFLTGQCGVIVPGPGGWESPGRFYPPALVRVTVTRLPPCAP